MKAVGRVTLWSLAALGIALSSHACGAGGDGGENDGGVPACSLSLSVSPSQVYAPGQVVVGAEPLRFGGASGLETFDWEVRKGAVPVPWQSFGVDDRAIAFTASEPGSYEVIVYGSVGVTACSDGIVEISASDPALIPGVYRLRIVPPPSLALPPQEQLITVGGASEVALGSLSLDPGLLVAGSVEERAGQPGSAYLRFTGSSGTVESFADASGAFQARLPLAAHEVLVVPSDPSAAPYRAGYAAGASTLALSPGVERVLAVTVTDPSGAPLSGARLAASRDGVPSTVATSDAAGAATLLTRPGDVLGLRVIPPEASALPRLDLLDGAALLSEASALEVVYSPALAFVVVSATVSVGGAVEPGAKVGFLAELPNVAEVRDGLTVLTVGGAFERQVIADASGALPPTTLPVGNYRVVITTAAGVSGALGLALSSPPPTTLEVPAPVMVSGRLVDAELSDAAGVALVATPTAALARGGASQAQTLTGSDGSFSLPLAAGGAYVLRSAANARHPAVVIVPLALESSDLALGTVVMPSATVVTGTLVAPGVSGGVGAASLVLWPHGDLDSITPMAEAVSRPDGRFELVVPTGN